MGMTEKQGGSDVRANTTRAERIGASGISVTTQVVLLLVRMCDACLIRAATANGLSCFLLPLGRPRVQDQLLIQPIDSPSDGNRPNVPSEFEFSNAWAQLVGAEGRGINTSIEKW